MDNCIARQPIIGKDGKIAAYELLYFQNSQTVDSPHDFHTAIPLAEAEILRQISHIFSL